MTTGGPRNNPEPDPRKHRYPVLKKGQLVKCTGCKDGKVMHARGVIKDCKACHGTGKVKVK